MWNLLCRSIFGYETGVYYRTAQSMKELLILSKALFTSFKEREILNYVHSMRTYDDGKPKKKPMMYKDIATGHK